MEFGREMSRLSRHIYREFCLFFLVLLVIFCKFLPFMFCQFSLLGKKKIPLLLPFRFIPRYSSAPPLFSFRFRLRRIFRSCSKNLVRISTGALFTFTGTFRNIRQSATGICRKTHQRGPQTPISPPSLIYRPIIFHHMTLYEAQKVNREIRTA